MPVLEVRRDMLLHFFHPAGVCLDGEQQRGADPDVMRELHEESFTAFKDLVKGKSLTPIPKFGELHSMTSLQSCIDDFRLLLNYGLFV